MLSLSALFLCFVDDGVLYLCGLQGDYHYTYTMKEPLEVTFPKLLKVDTSAAIMFLERKGLYVKPMPLAERLQ